MRHTGCLRSRLRAALLGCLLVAVGITACGPPSAEPAAKTFLATWARGDLVGAGRLTTDPTAATEALKESMAGLGQPKINFDLGTVSTDGANATARYRAHVVLAGLPTWSFASRLLLHRSGDRWRVTWSPTDIHAGLTPTTHLAVIRSLPPRAALLDDHGDPLFKLRPVVHIGIEPARLHGHAAATIRSVAAAVGVHDVAALRKAVHDAPPHQFVPVITLRRPAYEVVKPRIYSLPGTVFHADHVLLPPQTGFAQALLGTVGTATADVLKSAGPDYRPGDVLGLSGLQAHYQRRLAGRAGGRVVVADSIGTASSTLATFPATPGTDVRTTLDVRVQTAAEDALAHEQRPAALVAVRASTGDILAVANTPDASSFNRAFLGHYPPGSTFKVATTYALLGHGVTPSTTIDCPSTINVGGREFRNFESEAVSHPSFATDFAKSCNTAFIGASRRLAAKDLTDAAHALGIGNDWGLPLPAFSGAVPPPADEVTNAADAIGQGSVAASPLAMAMVAASVSSGQSRAPVLVTDPKQRPASIDGTSLESRRIATLHRLMRLVVTSGTAASAGLPTASYGKTGTAEFGTDNPPKTHAWFIGWRHDVAFAVLIESGGVGGQVAAPIAAAFLRGLD